MTPDLPHAVIASSYEVRWFFDGEPPDAVIRLIADPRRDGWPPPRTDRYLNFAADMGLKLRREPDRPALLEFKGRQHLVGPVSLAPEVSGVASTWTKWSYRAEEAPPALRAACESPESSAAVKKRRILRRFRFDAAGSALEVGLDVRLDRGVQLELTRLEVSGPGSALTERQAWTLGLEAFPLFPGLEEVTHQALAAPLSDLAGAGCSLDEAHSASYPEWLSALNR